MDVNTKALFLAAVAFLASAAAAPANAGGNPPEFDPERIEFATPISQSSDCLGDLSTLICAAHTSVVCSILRERPDCRALPYVGHFSNQPANERLEYKFVDAGTISRERYAAFARSHADELRYGPTSYGWVKPGIGQVRFMRRSCGRDSSLCEGARWIDSMLVFEFDKGGWRYRNGMSFLPEDWFID